MLRNLCLMVILIATQHAVAQNKGSTNDEPATGNMSRFLNDGKVRNVNNLVRIRLNRSLAGYFGLSYERRIARKFGLEVGAYSKPIPILTWNDQARQLLAQSHESLITGATKEGICYMVYPKYYILGKSINNLYFYGLRNYYSTCLTTINSQYIAQQPDVATTSISSMLMWGYHRNTRSRIVFGFDMGIGYFKDTYKGVTFGKYDAAQNKLTSTYKKDIVLSNIFLGADIIFGILF